MSLIDDVRAAVTSTRLGESEPPTVVFGREARAGKTLAGLQIWFDGQDRYSQVAVMIAGQYVGYLGQDSVLLTTEPVMKGFGAGDYSMLPGDRFLDETGLKCPEGDHHIWVVCYDPADRLTCPRHHVVLEVDTE
jgi:hypothetical protein